MGEKEIPKAFRNKRIKVKKHAYPQKFRIPKVYEERKLKEPQPLIDVLEDKNEITIVAEFAGFKRENLKLDVKNQRLTLSAESSNRRYHKSLNLPSRVIPDTIHTTYKNGLLEIHLKKLVHEEKTIDKVAG